MPANEAAERLPSDAKGASLALARKRCALREQRAQNKIAALPVTLRSPKETENGPIWLLCSMLSQPTRKDNGAAGGA